MHTTSSNQGSTQVRRLPIGIGREASSEWRGRLSSIFYEVAGPGARLDLRQSIAINYVSIEDLEQTYLGQCDTRHARTAGIRSMLRQMLLSNPNSTLGDSLIVPSTGVSVQPKRLRRGGMAHRLGINCNDLLLAGDTSFTIEAEKRDVRNRLELEVIERGADGYDRPPVQKLKVGLVYGLEDPGEFKIAFKAALDTRLSLEPAGPISL